MKVGDLTDINTKVKVMNLTFKIEPVIIKGSIYDFLHSRGVQTDSRMDGNEELYLRERLHHPFEMTLLVVEENFSFAHTGQILSKATLRAPSVSESVVFMAMANSRHNSAMMCGEISRSPLIIFPHERIKLARNRPTSYISALEVMSDGDQSLRRALLADAGGMFSRAPWSPAYMIGGVNI